MRRIVVNAYQIALVFKRGKLTEVLDSGAHWIAPFREVIVYDVTKPFPAHLDLSTLVNDPLLEGKLQIVQVEDGYIGIEYRNDLYVRILDPGMYAYWDGPVQYDVINYDTSELEVPEGLTRSLYKRAEFLTRIRVHQVTNYEKGILMVNGELREILDSGTYYYWKNDLDVVVFKADFRTQSLEVGGQEILTKDKAAVRVNFQAQYKVEDIVTALVENHSYSKQLYAILQLIIREYLGTMTLDQILANKDSIGKYVLEAGKDQAENLGIRMISGGIKDIILPGDVKDIINQVLIAQKKAQANTIMRQEETASTRSLLNTAKLMENNEMLYKLKEMEYMEKIADRIGEITVSGGGKVLDQLKEIFAYSK